MGGIALFYVQYCLGLRDLGVDVAYVENSDGVWPYDPQRDEPAATGAYTVPWLTDLFAGFGLRWAYQDPAGMYHGASEREVEAWCDGADLLLNVSGSHVLGAHHRRVRARAYIDTDPGVVQVRAAGGDPSAWSSLGDHQLYFTYAEALGRDTCRIPDLGIAWRTTRPPVHLPLFTPLPPAADGAYTTVMAWRVYEPLLWGGERWGNKEDEFHHLAAMPGRTGLPLELAVRGHGVPYDELRTLGWRLRDPRGPTRTVEAYLDYLRASRGELTVAKQIYVRSGSGWFSERSANYLALGRPVITQDTGFSAHLPTGRGLLAFDDIDGAEAALRSVETDLAGHGAAARAIAETHFDARLVLSRMLSDAGVE